MVQRQGLTLQRSDPLQCTPTHHKPRLLTVMVTRTDYVDRGGGISVPNTLCHIPSTLCSTPSTLCSPPSTRCRTPSTLCSTPSTRCRTLSTLLWEQVVMTEFCAFTVGHA